MKNRILPLLITLGLVVVLLNACASTSSKSLIKKTSDDCLVLIKTTLTNKSRVPTAFTYYFKLSNDYPTLAASHHTDDFMTVLIREPGVKIVSLSTRITDSQVKGESSNLPFDFTLPYKPGEVVVADFSFANILEKVDTYNFISHFDLPTMTPEAKDALLEQFLKTKAAASWN
jgi:hypothetical protein